MRSIASKALGVSVDTYLQVSGSQNDRSRLLENQRRLDELLRSSRMTAALGMDQYTMRSER